MDATTSAFLEATGQTAGDFFTSVFPLIYWFFFVALVIFVFAFIYRAMGSLPRGASRIIRGKRY